MALLVWAVNARLLKKGTLEVAEILDAIDKEDAAAQDNVARKKGFI